MSPPSKWKDDLCTHAYFTLVQRILPLLHQILITERGSPVLCHTFAMLETDPSPEFPPVYC